ncbi:Com family DNA-binding transcriptional regulator [Clostridium sp. AWRP]|uniref:Com family DNA-binding transcriptional regulator n=1 Tax=Clostridium sp. AWRP TaxID=2212991 RepID=UPI000FDC0892|nr:Com family DNA-binding transcriptional regulator [Clostridium sp. AWRP]AZV56065.1 Com family DNA-binding transcriptional regulator [Clostridium sp. AWRP]
MSKIRCKSCGKLLMEAEGNASIEIKCPRCRNINKYSIKERDISHNEFEKMMGSRSYKRVRGALRQK